MYFLFLSLGFSGFVICKSPSSISGTMWLCLFMDWFEMPSISIISLEERGTVQKSLEEERQDLTTTIRSKTSDGTNLTQNIDK